MNGDDYIMMSAAVAVSIILIVGLEDVSCTIGNVGYMRVVTTPEHGKRDGKFRR